MNSTRTALTGVCTEVTLSLCNLKNECKIISALQDGRSVIQFFRERLKFICSSDSERESSPIIHLAN